MLRRTAISVVIGFIASAGMAGPASAEPDESQRLRGLGGRVFLVQVQDLFAEPGSPDEFFDNCYTFYPDGVWDDPFFPVLGEWNQDSVGAKTRYTGEALAEDFNLAPPEEPPFLVDLLLEQVGHVTPARGSGTLQLSAFSQAFFVDFFGPGENLLVGEFISTGYEVDECPL